MSSINIFFIFLLISYFISNSYCFSFGVKDDYGKSCFTKFIKEGDQITLSFVITSYPKELINVDLSFRKNKYEQKSIIYQVENKDKGDYNSQNSLQEGYYELCFYSKKGKEYYVSMEFSTLFEDHNLKKMATDKEVKTINKDIKEMKTQFEKIEINARHLIDVKYYLGSILYDLTNSIKTLTYLKIFANAVLSVFQIYIIQKFFGPDRRVTSIKGAFSDKSIL